MSVAVEEIVPVKKMTKAEKKALKKAQKLAAEEEARREIFRAALSRSLAVTKKSEKELLGEYRTKLLQITVGRFKEDLLNQVLYFEKVIDSKDFTISFLMDEIDNGNAQYMRNFSAHISAIDRIIGLFQKTVEDLHDEYLKRAKQMFSAKDNITNQMGGDSNSKEFYFKQILFQLEMDDCDTRNTMLADYLSKVTEEDDKFSETSLLSKDKIDTRILALWTSYKKFFESYLQHIDETRKVFVAIQKKDEMSANEQEVINTKTDYLYETIKNLKESQKTNRILKEKCIEDLELEKTLFDNIFWDLRKQLATEQICDATQKRTLCNKSFKMKEYLRDLIYKGTNILKLAAICRKYETQEEKIKMFDYLESDYENFIAQQGIERKDLEVYLIDRFYSRSSNAKILSDALRRELKYLKYENSKISDILYMQKYKKSHTYVLPPYRRPY